MFYFIRQYLFLKKLTRSPSVLAEMSPADRFSAPSQGVYSLGKIFLEAHTAFQILQRELNQTTLLYKGSVYHSLLL